MRIIPFIIVMITVACQSTKKEVLDLNDIMPASENYKEGEITGDSAAIKKDEFVTNLNFELLSKMKISCDNKFSSDTLLFPDRFSPITLTKFNYLTDKETVNYSKFNFKDSSKTLNTFINWANCFGIDCSSIRIGESKNLQKNGFLMMVNDTSIIYISSNSPSEKKKWLEYYLSEKGIHWRYILDQNKYGKVKWQSYQENKLSSIEAPIKSD